MRTSISSQTLNGIYKQSNKTLKINSTLLKNSLKRTKCCVKPDELVTLIKKHYWDKTKTVKYQTTDGSEVSHRTYSFEAKLKDCDIPIKFVVIFGKWNKDDDNTYHILITNQLTASAKTVITNYLLRWGIEHCFNEFKCAINSLLEFSSTSELSKNKELADRYFKIKSNRLKKKLVA